MIKKVFAIASIILLWSCGSKKEPNHFSDPVLLRIADFQDRRLSDSLYQYFLVENITHRSAAVLAFASLQDTTASEKLGTLLLEDPAMEVRRRAAFALGQTGGTGSVNALIPAASDSNKYVIREVLEALGKTITLRDIEVLKNFQVKDSLSEEGLAWAFYRLGLRRVVDTTITSRQAEFLDSKYGISTRLAAAQYFNRAPVIGTQFEKKLAEASLTDSSPEVRMNAAGGLRKLKNDFALETLRKILSIENDYRVKVNVIRALQPFAWDKTKDIFIKALTDSSEQVAVAAAELLKTIIKRPDPALLEQAHATNGRVQANLYEVILSLEPDSKPVIEEVKQKYQASSSNYQKAQLLSALSKATSSHPFIFEQLMASGISVIMTSAAQALADGYRADAPSNLKLEYIRYYQQAIALGDPGVVGILASSIADSANGFRPLMKDFTFLYKAREGLRLPKDIESLLPLEEAIAFLESKPKPAVLRPLYNHPIDWNLVKSIPTDQRVSIKTAKGEIVIRLFVEEAPGSVANFVDLVNKNYYDGRFIHRVVPNFVVQTGCKRGDGFGSEDYSIRSEFSMRRYAKGSVGYASAGKDTEGTQWFVTHAATPHLDGRYTIYAEVIRGMEIGEKLNVGDQVISVSLVKN